MSLAMTARDATVMLAFLMASNGRLFCTVRIARSVESRRTAGEPSCVRAFARRLSSRGRARIHWFACCSSILRFLAPCYTPRNFFLRNGISAREAQFLYEPKADSN